MTEKLPLLNASVFPLAFAGGTGGLVSAGSSFWQFYQCCSYLHVCKDLSRHLVRTVLRNTSPVFQVAGVVYWFVPARRLTWIFILGPVGRNQRFGLIIVAVL